MANIAPRWSWIRRVDAWLLATVLVAFGLRLAWALYADADPTDGRFDDSLLYHFLAIGIRDHSTYVNPFTGVATGTWPPGYPAFLAAVYSIFGVNVKAALAVQALLGALTVGATYLLGRQLFDRVSAAIAALLLAVMPGQIFFAGILWSEVLFTLLFVLALIAIAALSSRPERERLAWAVATALLVAAAAYVRETGLLLIPVAALYWGWSLRSWRSSLRFAGAAALLVALLILPWAVRNTTQLDGFVVLSSSTGTNFWRGHHSGATGGFDSIEPLIAASKPRDQPGGEADAHQRGMREGLEFLARNPLDEAKLSTAKVRWLYQGDRRSLQLTEADGQVSLLRAGVRSVFGHLADAAYYAVLTLSGVAMVRWVRERGSRPILPVLAIGVVTLGYVAFWGDARFHAPLMPLFCLLAGWALQPLLRPPA
ncbi:MAG: glycosyltransferase family 39 protein [Dehalococcoidia bacterium]